MCVCVVVGRGVCVLGGWVGGCFASVHALAVVCLNPGRSLLSVTAEKSEATAASATTGKGQSECTHVYSYCGHGIERRVGKGGL